MIAWNLESIDAASSPVNVFAIPQDFAARNISAIGVMAAPEGWTFGHLDIIDTRYNFDGRVTPPNGEHNVMMLTPPIDSEGTAPEGLYEFILYFDEPVSAFTITRCAIAGGEDKFTHPAWKIDAYDASLELITSNGEDELSVGIDPVDKAFITVAAPGICSVRIISDGRSTSVPGVLIDAFSVEVE